MMSKQPGRKIVAKCKMYIRVSANAPNPVEFYSPFFIDETEIVGAYPGDVFEIIDENEEGVMASNREQNEVWISNRLLWKFDR